MQKVSPPSMVLWGSESFVVLENLGTVTSLWRVPEGHGCCFGRVESSSLGWWYQCVAHHRDTELQAHVPCALTQGHCSQSIHTHCPRLGDHEQMEPSSLCLSDHGWAGVLLNLNRVLSMASARWRFHLKR